jgi:radical SAM protein with 4Fe4S-binding SPASM domain
MKANAMKAQADVVLDRAAFARMKRIMPTYLAARRLGWEGADVRPLPDEIAFKLTNQCNLRCKHCYQWGADGHHHDLDLRAQREHLAFDVVERVFAATRELGSNVYLWGGEPLLYRHWDELAGLLARDPRWTTICTNGFFLEKRLESLLRISARLELDVAVDGLEREHDGLRGEGAFARTLRGIGALLDRRREGDYAGEITVNCVITDALVPRVVEVVEFWEGTGVDALYLALPWFLSATATAAMDRYVARHLPWIRAAPAVAAGRPSWRGYGYGMDPAMVTPLLAQLAAVNRRSWRIKVRYNPALAEGDFPEFLAGSERPAAGKTRCLAILSRLDVMPSGDVVSCKFFPESAVGNLHDEDAATIWHGPRFQRVRRTLDRCGLMPVCAKCSLLYSRGA